ncbi:hypothetical protein UFOVP381_14 [uncultured Caudovirales phage]|uniref:Uncharacterized protein n=1 Tax=uncultured Caudovirales phage TaxID=2100421 RepID=A0A6J7X287_9CAUD|nr:hypothetical protein UFOVP381_14 [uncultured Caudovirales phage]
MENMKLPAPRNAMQDALIKALRDPAKLGRFVQQEIDEEGDEMGEYHAGILPKAMSKDGKPEAKEEKMEGKKK